MKITYETRNKYAKFIYVDGEYYARALKMVNGVWSVVSKDGVLNTNYETIKEMKAGIRHIIGTSITASKKLADKKHDEKRREEIRKELESSKSSDYIDEKVPHISHNLDGSMTVKVNGNSYTRSYVANESKFIHYAEMGLLDD